MNWYTRNLRQTATYWPPPIKDAWSDQTYPSPASVACHWKEEARQFAAPTGVMAVSKAVVHVESNIEPDGFLYLETTSAATGSPRTLPNAQRIQQVEKIPALRQDVTVYVAFL